ncbi:MAG: serine/threonine protein kinase [Deltaproteobacteria bacterium]|nr:serine/threonine protein kinase [Deltaproteobacteria bacterium]
MMVEIGDRVRYRLVRRLSVGGMSELFLAEQLSGSLTRPVVLKRLLPALAKDSTHRALFIEEARLAGRLRHPAIPVVYGLLDSLEPPVIVMEWVRGVSLRALIRQVEGGKARPFSLPEVFGLIREVAGVLDYLSGLEDESGRAAPLYHRDLSPENIVIDENGRVHVVDFGIAKSSDSRLATETGVLKGRLAYLPPEVVRGEAFGPTGDLYALGLIAVELVTGNVPGFEPDTARQLSALRDRKGPPPLPPELPGRVFFETLLAASPDMRPPVPRSFLDGLERAWPAAQSGADVTALWKDRIHDIQAAEEAVRPVTEGLESLPLLWGEATPVMTSPRYETDRREEKSRSFRSALVLVTIVVSAILAWSHENFLWYAPWETESREPGSGDVGTVMGGEQLKILPPVMPVPRKPAVVEVVAPELAELYVSGKFVGTVAGSQTIELEPGSHVIELRIPARGIYFRHNAILVEGSQETWAPGGSPAWQP